MYCNIVRIGNIKPYSIGKANRIHPGYIRVVLCTTYNRFAVFNGTKKIVLNKAKSRL